MIATLHIGLTSEKWNSKPMEKRILNIVSELTRAKSFAVDGQADLFRDSLERVLELMDLTTDSWKAERSSSWLKEFLRLRETIASVYAEPTDKAVTPKEIINFINVSLDLEPACHNLGLEI